MAAVDEKGTNAFDVIVVTSSGETVVSRFGAALHQATL
jgi:hypothetical protein